MTDAPKRIWADPPETFDGMDVWRSEPGGKGVEYILASEHAALIREAEAERDEAQRLMQMRHREMLAADELMRKHQGRAVAAEADRDRLAAANAALEARVAGLRDFVDDFAKAKIDALRYERPYGSSPEDDPDPVVDAETVWAWQADAKAALATQEGNPV